MTTDTADLSGRHTTHAYGNQPSSRQAPPAPSIALLLVGVMTLAVSWNAVRFGSNAIVDFLMLPAAAAAIVKLLASGRSVPVPWWLLATGLAIGLAALLSSVFAPNPALLTNPEIQQLQAAGFAVRSRSDVASALKFEVGIVVLPLLIAAVATSRRNCRRIADLWASSCLISGTIAVTDLFHLTHLSPIPSTIDARQSGLTVQPNHLGLTCAMAIPLVTAWYNRGGRWRLASLAGVAVLLGGVYASGSRAGTVAALFALLGTVIVVPKLRAALPNVLPVIGMLAIVVLFSPLPQQVVEKVRFSGNDANVAASNQERAAAASLALNDIQTRPVEGVGFGVIDDAHNIYLQLLAAGGIIMFAAFLFYLRGVTRMALRLVRGPDSDLSRAMSIGLLVWLLNGLIGNQVTDRYIYVPVGVLLGLSSCAVARSMVPGAAAGGLEVLRAVGMPGRRGRLTAGESLPVR